MDVSSREALIAEVAEYARTVVHGIGAATTHEWLQLDLTMAQLKALFVLAAAAPVPMGALAHELGTHFSAASHVVDRLVQLNLAERYEDPEDRRRTFVRLSEQGNVLVQQLRQGKNERFSNWLAAINDEDLAALHKGLREFARIMITLPM